MDSASQSVDLFLPAAHLPAHILAVDAIKGNAIKRDDTLFSYNFFEDVAPGDNELPLEANAVGTVRVKRFAEFRAPMAGIVRKISVRPGMEISSDGLVVATLYEECAHDQVFGGMCCICGKDLTQLDYTTDESALKRANIAMAHDTTGVRVSKREAQRLEMDTVERLSKRRKLTLILDLDMTVIHTISDPTVNEWKNDPAHPYWGMLQDVAGFTLPNDSRTYYVKLRPHTREFLTNIAKLYEFHIYTAGSRNYANMIAQIIDPKGEIFQERILSRDESGSDKKKSLARLFPCDQSMVAIVDDNALTWNMAHNLVMIKKFNFFVGVGDINSSIQRAERERLRRLTEKKMKEMQEMRADDRRAGVVPFVINGEEEDDGDTRMAEEGQDEMQEYLEEMEKVQEEEMDLQARERPLMARSKIKGLSKPDGNLDRSSTDELPSGPRNVPHLLLDDNDQELEFVEKLLKYVHSEFFRQWEECERKGSAARPDVGRILWTMKKDIFRGCRILLSGLIPQGKDVAHSDCETYHLITTHGGEVIESLDDDVTHIVAVSWGTKKCYDALKRGIWVVSPEWVGDSVARLEKCREEEYVFSEWERGLSELQRDDGEEASPVNMELLSPAMDKQSYDDALAEVEAELGGFDSDFDDEEDDEEGKGEEGAENKGKKREVLGKRGRSDASSASSHSSASSSLVDGELSRTHPMIALQKQRNQQRRQKKGVREDTESDDSLGLDSDFLHELENVIEHE